MNAQDAIAALKLRIQDLEARRNAVPLRVARGGGGGDCSVFVTAESIATLPTPDGTKFARIIGETYQKGRILSPNADLTGWDALNYLGS